MIHSGICFPVTARQGNGRRRDRYRCEGWKFASPSWSKCAQSFPAKLIHLHSSCNRWFRILLITFEPLLLWNKTCPLTMRQLEAANIELQAAKAKLRQAGLTLTPDRSRPAPAQLPMTTERLASPSGASGVPTGSPTVAVPDCPANRRRTEASPAKQQSLTSMFAAPGKAEESPKVDPTLTPDQALEPKAVVLRPHTLVGTSVPSVKKWMEPFPVETEQLSKKVLEMLQGQDTPRKFCSHLLRHSMVFLSGTLLLQVISISAAMSAWLAGHVRKLPQCAAMTDISSPRQFFIHIIHDFTATAKTVAIWSLGLLHLICLSHFPARTLHTNLWPGRLRSLGVNPCSYTSDWSFWGCHCCVFDLSSAMGAQTTWSVLHQFHQHCYQAGFQSHGKTPSGQTWQSCACWISNEVLGSTFWFSIFTILVPKTFYHYSEAWTLEHVLMSKWRAPLNYPFVFIVLI